MEWATGRSLGFTAGREACTTLYLQAVVIGGLFNLSLYFIIWKRTSRHKSGELMGLVFRNGRVPASALSPTCCLALSKKLPFSEPQLSHL